MEGQKKILMYLIYVYIWVYTGWFITGFTMQKYRIIFIEPN